MAGFNYRFETIFRLKQQIEEQKKIELSQIQKKIFDEKTKLQSLNDDLKLHFSTMEGHLVGSIDTHVINYDFQRVSAIVSQIEAQHVFIEKLRESEKKKMNEVKDAIVDRKAFEKLKEKDYLKWKDQENKKEQKFLDFLNIVPKKDYDNGSF